MDAVTSAALRIAIRGANTGLMVSSPARAVNVTNMMENDTSDQQERLWHEKAEVREGQLTWALECLETYIAHHEGYHNWDWPFKPPASIIATEIAQLE